jgi:cytochrome c biogenesis protein CcmG/thiol:disulfide interchange protein DsbE
MHKLIGAAVIALLFQSADAETKIVEYLKANVQPGKPVVVSELNKMFTAPDEQKVLNRLFNTFFKIPMFMVQYNASTKKIPTLQELAEQFNFKVPGESDVMLRIMESDPRIPKFLTRDAKSGEITAIDVPKITASPQFGRVLERTIAGWEGKTEPEFAIQTYDGKPLTSQDLAGKPHLVYIWFTNCPPCVKTSPLLAKLYTKYSSQGFKIVAANSDKVLDLPYDDAMRADYVKKIGINFTTAYLNAKMQSDYGGVSVFPTMFFIDKDGVIVKHFVNFQYETVIEAAIHSAMGK